MKATALIEGFAKEFEQHLDGSRRWKAFLDIVVRLAYLNRPVFILETGCARMTGNWHGDGQSTLLWDWIADYTRGGAISVDIDPDAVKLADSQCPGPMKVICTDSIDFLRNFDDAAKVDLLYLDAYDWGDTKLAKTMSELHHVGELAAIYERLSPGCLIAIDDCHQIDQGKHVLVQEFFNRLDVKPVFRSYITVWKKP